MIYWHQKLYPGNKASWGLGLTEPMRSRIQLRNQLRNQLLELLSVGFHDLAPDG
jgi:hypothetical protein